jgi:hypothetical protein
MGKVPLTLIKAADPGSLIDLRPPVRLDPTRSDIRVCPLYCAARPALPGFRSAKPYDSFLTTPGGRQGGAPLIYSLPLARAQDIR